MEKCTKSNQAAVSLVIICHWFIKMLFDPEALSHAKAIDFPFECYQCHNSFVVPACEIRREIKRGNYRFKFCSRKCFNLHNQNRIQVVCANCGVEIYKTPTRLKRSKSGNSFCSKSCAAVYNNAHKTSGTRRSKIEIWIEDRLLIDYPSLDILFNKTDAINSELDVYIPNIQLAVELNGIFHYEPIYGKEKLSSIQNNDDRKFQACLERGIELLIIDISHMKRFNQIDANRYYSIIRRIIDAKRKV